MLAVATTAVGSVMVLFRVTLQEGSSTFLRMNVYVPGLNVAVVVTGDIVEAVYVAPPSVEYSKPEAASKLEASKVTLASFCPLQLTLVEPVILAANVCPFCTTTGMSTVQSLP